jgi:hypothetical protein
MWRRWAFRSMKSILAGGVIAADRAVVAVGDMGSSPRHSGKTGGQPAKRGGR